MYNLTIADAHTYFVGDGQWLVHNCATRPQGSLRSIGPNTWRTRSGLEYGPENFYKNRVRHVIQHAQDDLSKRTHGVFDGGRTSALAFIDEAYETILLGNPNRVNISNRGALTVYDVDMGRKIGYVGGREGARANNPIATRIRLVLDDNRVITAFPIE